MVSDSLKFVHSLDLLMSSQSLLVRVIWWGKKRAKLSSPTFRQLCQFKTSWDYEKGGNLFSDLNINWQILLILIGCARVHKISDSCLIFRASAFYLPKKIKKHEICKRLTVCFHHVTYAFQSESTLYSCLNLKELLAGSRREIWSLSDSNWTRAHSLLVRKRTLNHLAKLAKSLSCVVSTYLQGAFDCMFLSCHVRVSEWIHIVNI